MYLIQIECSIECSIVWRNIEPVQISVKVKTVVI